FLDEQALAADLGQAPVEDLVAERGHAKQGNPVAARAQKRLHMLGLPQGQAAFARGDDDVQGIRVHGAVRAGRGARNASMLRPSSGRPRAHTPSETSAWRARARTTKTSPSSTTFGCLAASWAT